MQRISHLTKRSAQRNGLALAQARPFAGGGAKLVKIPDDQTDFDICVIGGLNATALTKFWQNDHIHEKMAIVSERPKFMIPELYMFASYAVIKEFKAESSAVGSQIDKSSRVNTDVRVTSIKPGENKITLGNGKEYSYRALVLGTGLDSKAEYIEGLAELEAEGEQSGVFVHLPDVVQRLDRNYYHGWQFFHGDMVVYNPAFPYKDEGLTFFTFYYEHLLRQEQLFERAARNAQIHYVTPNKCIFEFPYANEVTLDECEKRGIKVHFG